jgi:hypothetical protein
VLTPRQGRASAVNLQVPGIVPAVARDHAVQIENASTQKQHNPKLTRER